MLYLLSSILLFIGDIIDADNFKNQITPSLKANYRLKFAQDMALNHVIDNRKPWWKLSYKVLKEENGYDSVLGISTYTTLIQLKDFLGGM